MATINGKPFEEVLKELGAPVFLEDVELRQMGKVNVFREDDKARDKYSAQFVPYVLQHVVRRRLDAVAPGGWSLRTVNHGESKDLDGGLVMVVETTIAIRLDNGEVLERSNYGEGDSLKAAATDSFKRAATRFGIGEELMLYPNFYVDMSGAHKNAAPLAGWSGLPELFQRKCTAYGMKVPSKAGEVAKVAKVELRNQPAVAEQIAALYDVLNAEVFSADERRLVDEWLRDDANLVPGKIQQRVDRARKARDQRMAALTPAGASAV